MGIDPKRTSHLLLFMVVLPGLSVFLAWLSFHAFSAISWSYSFALDGVGVLGAYGLLYKFFDLVAWRWRVFRFLRVVYVPDMSGRWKGTLRSSRPDQPPIAAIVEVEQWFSRARVHMYFERSRSFSVMTQFVREGNGVSTLHYEYQNEPGFDAPVTMHPHFGTARLACIPGKQRIEGEYYNRGRDDRGYVGGIAAEYAGKVLLKRFDD
jgi:SMODS-associating 2TM, beta-strand rich effector domain